MMTSFPLVSTSKGILAVGGSTCQPHTVKCPNEDEKNRRMKNEILQLKCPEGQEVSDCYWAEFPQKLAFGRFDHVVIPLPASYEVPCTN